MCFLCFFCNCGAEVVVGVIIGSHAVVTCPHCCGESEYPRRVAVSWNGTVSTLSMQICKCHTVKWYCGTSAILKLSCLLCLDDDQAVYGITV